MRKARLAALIGLSLASGGLATSESEVLLPMHQEIPLALAHHVTSAYNDQGTEVFFRVAEDVIVDGQVLVGRGEVVTGRVGATKKGRSFGRSGSIDLTVRTVRAVDETLVPLGGEITFKGRSRTGATVGAWVGLGVVGGFLVKGRSAVLEKGDLFSAYVAADRQILPVERQMESGHVDYLEAAASAPVPSYVLAIEKKKKLKPLEFRFSPPQGSTVDQIEGRSIELFRVAATTIPEPVVPESLVSEGASLAAHFDAWQVVCYCDPGPCELEFRGSLTDGTAWSARSEFALQVKKKEPKK